MGRKRETDRRSRVTGKEDAIFLDDWYLDEADAEPLEDETQTASFRTQRGGHVERKMTRRERKAIERAEKEAEKARKIQEAAEWKAEQKALRREEKAAKREAARKKAEKKKMPSRKKSHPVAPVEITRNAPVKGTEKNKTVSAREQKKKRSRFPHSSLFLTGKWRRMESAGCRINIIRKAFAFMISTTSWRRMRIRMLFLKTGVISSTTLTARSISSYLL